MTHYPKTIEILSDGNLLEYEGVGKIGKLDVLNYRYTKSDCKLGWILPLPPEQLEKMILNNIARIV